MKLENMIETYQSINSNQDRQIYFVAGDLEVLSASVLYSYDIKPNGVIETIIPRIVNNDTLKIYENPLNGNTSAGYQNGGESHKDYSNSGRLVNLPNGNYP